MSAVDLERVEAEAFGVCGGVGIGAGGTVGGGSTVTKDTAPGVLTVARGKQLSLSSCKRPEKKK